jgi:hypothetical protein
MRYYSGRQRATPGPSPLRPWRVTTTTGTVEVMAATLAEAIRAGLELTGPRSTLLSCLQTGDW